MDITASVAKHCGVSIFSIFEERADRVIDVINYFIEAGDRSSEGKETEKTISRKNDGFWDM